MNRPHIFFFSFLKNELNQMERLDNKPILIPFKMAGTNTPSDLVIYKSHSAPKPTHPWKLSSSLRRREPLQQSVH